MHWSTPPHALQQKALDNIKLTGEIPRCHYIMLNSCFSSVPFFFFTILRWQCPEAVSAYLYICNFFLFSLAEKQCFSLDSAFLITDTLWYGEGFVSALAFIFYSFGLWATPECIHGNWYHNEQWFQHQPVWQRVSALMQGGWREMFAWQCLMWHTELSLLIKCILFLPVSVPDL